ELTSRSLKISVISGLMRLHKCARAVARVNSMVCCAECLRRRNVLTAERSAEMEHVNPDPHAHGYVFIPTNRVTGLFASYDDLEGALRELEPVAFDPQHIDVFAGEEGAELFDLCGQRHGVVTRMVMNLAALVSDDLDLRQQADATLRAG